MPVVGQLIKAVGKVGKKVFAEAVEVADGDTIDTGLRSIDAAVVTASVAGHIATISTISNGVITISLVDTTGAAVTTPETVYIIAIGDPR